MSTVAVVLAAGAGTRMKSARPKVIHEILGVPMVRLVTDSVAAAGCCQTLVTVSYEADMVRAALPEDAVAVHQDKPIGTANAVAICEPAITDPDATSLIVIAGDTPLIRPETLGSLIELRESTGAEMAVLTTVVDDPTGYGRIIRDATGQVAAIVEDRDATPEQRAICEVNTGIYCFKLDGLFGRIEHIGNDNAQGEYYLTDILALILADGGSVVAVPVQDSTEVMGVNNRLQLSEAAQVLQRRINQNLMLSGVTMHAPELTWVSPHASVEPDVEILPMTSVMGTSYVKSGSVLGPDTRIVNSIIGSGALVDSSIVLESSVGPDCTLGPRAYLRPGTHLDAAVKVGTSVEVKNSRIGAGTKIPHLSYIGDAEVGQNCNIGAGTITCNYDGFAKGRTVIGDGAFIGSDTMLVAPVSIGDGAATGAGSAITRDVPDGSLAVERAEQRTVDGWMARRRSANGTAE